MSRRRRKGDTFAQLAADSSPEDGGDPKKFHEKPWNAPKAAGRKSKQLCAQVRDALCEAVSACGEPALQAAAVGAVQPAPHTGRLQVAIFAPPDVGRDAVSAAVTRAAGHLRSEVARAINRRHTPELVFVVFET
ncbi:MAG: ribosome-binding factor A [Planctomycetes bacterium]|nr:ribosome-binding factor A [Planctomycetota bacterium]